MTELDDLPQMVSLSPEPTTSLDNTSLFSKKTTENLSELRRHNWVSSTRFPALQLGGFLIITNTPVLEIVNASRAMCGFCVLFCGYAP